MFSTMTSISQMASMNKIYITVKFRTTAEAGRTSSTKSKAILAIDYYSCPMIIDDKAYDCRLLIGDQEIELGKYYELPIIFLNKESVLPYLFVGKKFNLWEGRVIADGEVIKIS